MAIVDVEGEFSDSQALTATAASTNLIDLGVDRDMGRGVAMCAMITVEVAADFTTTDETYEFQFQTDDNDSFSSPTTLTTIAIAAASLTAGSVHILPLSLFNDRYIRMNYVLGGTTPTVTVSTHFRQTDGVPSNAIFYASGFTVS